MNHETHMPQEVIAFLKGLYNDEHDLEQVRQDLVSDYHASYGFERLVQAVHAQHIMVDVEEHAEGYITISENIDTDSWTCNNRVETAKKMDECPCEKNGRSYGRK